jgi:hypothetical protein
MTSKPDTPKPTEPSDRKLGEILLGLKYIDSDQLAVALAEQTQLNASSKKAFRLGEVLLFKKAITLDQLHSALRLQTSKAAKSRANIQEIKAKHEAESGDLKKLRESLIKPKEKPDKKNTSGFFSFLKKKT